MEQTRLAPTPRYSINLQKVLEGVNNLTQSFLFMEHLTMDEAIKYLKGQAKKAEGVPLSPHSSPTAAASNPSDGQQSSCASSEHRGCLVYSKYFFII